MIISLNNTQHLILLPKNITKEKFLSFAKVKVGSYFYKRLESIYIALTTSTVNLEEEYIQYYREYDTFENFIYHKYPYLNDEVRNNIIEKISTNKYILLRGYFFELSDYNIQTIMSDSLEFMEKINKLFKVDLYEN